MLSDIKEQPDIIGNLVDKYLPVDEPVQGVDLNVSNEEFKSLSKIYIVASGSSRNAGNIAKYFIEDITRIPVIVDYASEFAHRNPVIEKNDLLIAISQSGETADTFSALKVAVDKGAHTLAITNNPESRIYNLAESKMQVGAGKEKSIPATKSFTAQLISLYILALYLGEKRNTVDSKKIKALKQEFKFIKAKIEELIANSDNLDKIAAKIKDCKSIVLLGRAALHSAAQEGALKIKETSYIDANGYPTGEFLHGYMAVVDENIPVISIINSNKNNNYNLAVANTEEIKKKRNPYIIIIKNAEDKEIEKRAIFSDTDFIDIPEINDGLYPLLVVIELQLLSLKIAEALGRDVNNPRSLTKAITSEQ